MKNIGILLVKRITSYFNYILKEVKKAIVNKEEDNFMKYLLRHKGYFSMYFFLVLFAASLEVSVSYILELIMNVATAESNVGFLQLVFIVIGYIFFSSIAFFWEKYTRDRYALIGAFDLRSTLFSKIENMRISSFSQENLSYYLTKLNGEVDIVREEYYKNTMHIFYNLIQFVIALVITATMEPLIGFFIILMCIPAMLLPILSQKALENAKESTIDKLEKYTDFLNNVFNGFNTIHLLNAKRFFNSHHDTKNKDLHASQMYDRRINRIVGTASQTLNDILYLSTWLIGTYFVIKGELTLGELVAFSQLMIFIAYPIQSATDLLTQHFGGRKVYQSIEDFIHAPTDNNGQIIRQGSFLPFIKFNDLSLVKSEKRILDDINVAFYPHKKYIVIGESGSGKSTLIKTAMKFFDDYEGSITINDSEIKELDEDSLYQKIGLLEQNVTLFSGTLFENVTLFDNSYTTEQVTQALKKAGLEKFIQNQETHQVFGKGKEISGGERQRVGLARLLLRDFSFLVCDEPTTGLDASTAMSIENELFSLNTGMILVTHRYNEKLFENSDEILIMSEGKITGIGSFSDLTYRQRVRSVMGMD